MSQKAAHVLTNRQKKGALASLKKPKPPKNALVKNEIEYWPALQEAQCETFVKLLETLISSTDFKQHISIGLESTLRSIKSASGVDMLVIADEISPRWFGKHLIGMTLHKNQKTKIVIFPKLKDITKTLLKVPSIIFSINVKESKVEEFYSELSIHSTLLEHYYSIKPSTDVTVKRKKKILLIDDTPPVILLKKPFDSSRSFVPMETDEPSTTVKQDSGDFISFSKSTDNNKSLNATTPTPLYRPIMIKKVVGNPNRVKKRKQ